MIFRVIKDAKNPYVMINKEFLNDNELSLKAKGLLTYLLSLPDDWKIYESELIKHHKDGTSAIKSAIKELLDNNYISRKRLRNDKGQLAYYEYEVYENNHMRLSNVGLSNVGKSTPSNKELELYNKDTNTLPPQDGVAEKDYIYFEDLETNDYIKQVNNYISDRKKITKDNYNNAVDAIDDIIEIVEISGLNDMIKWYKQEKLENRSVENFILYKDRFYQEYDYEMEG